MVPPLPTTPLKYTIAHSLAEYTISIDEFSAQNPRHRLVVGACVIHTPPSGPPRAVLIQRAAADYYPDLWEVPGGSADAGETIIEGAVRELWEEAGLRAAHVREMIAFDEWEDGPPGSKRWRKLTFLVRVEGGEGLAPPVVTLDPEEHQAFVWATEEEVRADRVGEVLLAWTAIKQKADVLFAFERTAAASTAATEPATENGTETTVSK